MRICVCMYGGVWGVCMYGGMWDVCVFWGVGVWLYGEVVGAGCGSVTFVGCEDSPSLPS